MALKIATALSDEREQCLSVTFETSHGGKLQIHAPFNDCQEQPPAQSMADAASRLAQTVRYIIEQKTTNDHHPAQGNISLDGFNTKTLATEILHSLIDNPEFQRLQSAETINQLEIAAAMLDPEFGIAA